MTTGKPGMRTVIPLKGRVGKNLRERKLMGLPVTQSAFCYFLGYLPKSREQQNILPSPNLKEGRIFFIEGI